MKYIYIYKTEEHDIQNQILLVVPIKVVKNRKYHLWPKKCFNLQF